MTTERNAQGVDGLAEVMALFDGASGGPWEYRYVNGAGNEIYADVRSTMGERFADLVEVYGVSACQPPRFCIGYDRWVQFAQPHWSEMQEKNGRLIVAAVNYLRSHGEAIRDLVEADREYNHARMLEEVARHSGSHDDKRISRYRAQQARERRAAALAKFPEPRP